MLIPPRFQRRRQRIYLAAFLSGFATLAWLGWAQWYSSVSTPPQPGGLRVGAHPKAISSKWCPPEILHLRGSQLDLTDNVVYSRRCVKPVWSTVDRQEIAKIKEPLVKSASARTVNLKSCRRVDLPSCEPISLRVPRPRPTRTYSHLVFGVSTTYERLEAALPAFSHTLSGSESKLVAVLYDEQPGSKARDSLVELERAFHRQNVNLKAVRPRNSTLSIAQNHFAILADLLDAATPETQWLALVDDDTFIPSLFRLDQELKKHNHRRPAWLGALSEDADAVKRWGVMAYGGAGVFLSVPLAKQLLPRMTACLNDAHLSTGDVILSDCIGKHTTTKLTIVPGLYQHDLYGDLSGFYESGVQPLSVHHYRGWYREPLPLMASVVRLCGDCFLQRWQFGDDTLLANGYSITEYREGLGNIDLTRMETTWSQPGHSFDHSLGPLRPPLDERNKKSYRLRDAVWEDGSFRQTYIYKGEVGREEMDEVFELIWQPPR